MKEQKHIKSDGYEFEEMRIPFLSNNPRARRYQKTKHNKGIRRLYKKVISNEVRDDKRTEI